MRRLISAWVGPRRWGATLLLAMALSVACAERSEAPPDVLLISLDTVRADALDFLDAETAPHLAALARRGTVFTQAIAGSSWTLPSHAQMFTGQPPVVHGVRTDAVRIDPAVPTLPERLQAAGYWTAGLYTGWFVAGPYGFARGFDTYANAMTGGEQMQALLAEAVEGGDPERAAEVLRQRDVQSHRDVTSRNVVSRASGLVARAPGGPRFLFAHFMDPHTDFIPPPPFDTRFDPDYQGPFDGRDLASNPAIFDPARDPPRVIGERDLLHLRALYRGEIAWTDRAIGELLDALESSGRLEHTLIVVTADHGEEFFEHGRFGHRASLYDEVLRVPLLIVPPGGRPPAGPARVDLQVGLSDLLPTIADYAGLGATDTALGRSLRPLLEGERLPPRPLVSSLLLVGPARADGRTDLHVEALRTEEHKLVRMLEVPPDGSPRLSGVMLFDLVRDPGELDPITDPAHPAVRAAWARMEEQMDGLRRAWRSLPRGPVESRSTAVAGVFAEELAALGYTGGTVVHPWQVRALAPLPPLDLSAVRSGGN
ncbi:MAG: sulfatase [Planctomycetota bacterium]|jgi:arylsulfatase A-like enzyme